MLRLFIVGSGGFARDAIWLIEEINRYQNPGTPKIEPLGFISSNTDMENIHGVPFLGNDKWALENLDRRIRFIVAIGNPKARRKLAKKFEDSGFEAQTLIHPGVAYGQGKALGNGTMICPGASISLHTYIGDHVILNLNCTIGHDARIGDFTTISPGANISGNASLEEAVEIGSGAVVLPGVSIGKEAVLGAGGVATRNLAGGATYVGIPARKV